MSHNNTQPSTRFRNTGSRYRKPHNFPKSCSCRQSTKGQREHGRWSIHCGTQRSSSYLQLRGWKGPRLEQASRLSRLTGGRLHRKSRRSFQRKPESNRDPEPSGCRDRSCCRTNTGLSTPFQRLNSQHWRKPWYTSRWCWR
jgi:hypothetical protein